MDTARRLLQPEPGDWLKPRLLRSGPAKVPVGAVVPTGFEGVVRVLHPAGDGRPWSVVAAQSGRTVHPLVQWACIAEHFDGHGRSSDVDPDEGSIPAPTLNAILEHCPADGPVIHAVWDGFGFWEHAVDLNTLMHGQSRSYLLFEAPKTAMTRWPGMNPVWSQSANLIWPKDHSWCIATEIDWDSTLIAGSADLCAAVLTDDRLETFAVDYDDDLSWFADTINPRPPWLAALQSPDVG